MNILLIGHACGPGLGSEPGNTWNWAQSLSRHHRVWLITHPQFRARIEAWLVENPNHNLKFVWVNVSPTLDMWDPSRGERGIRLHYVLWLRKAYDAAEALCREIEFDVAHHVSWATLRAAPPLWRLPVPVVWGPVGGGQCAPFAFLGYFGSGWWREIVRSVMTQALYFSPSLRRAARSASVVFATNRETELLLGRFPGARVRYWLDCGLSADWVSPAPPAERTPAGFNILWAGRLEHRKALFLALQALACVKTATIRLSVVGTGPLRSELEALTRKLGLAERVTFLGSVPYADIQTVFQTSNAFLFTSLRDSSGTVVLEAMAKGLPIITLDHQGVGTFVPNEAGIKVPVTNPRETIKGIADAIEKLAGSSVVLRSMQLAGWRCAGEQTWDHRADKMGKIYEEVVYHRRHPGMSKETVSSVQVEP